MMFALGVALLLVIAGVVIITVAARRSRLRARVAVAVEPHAVHEQHAVTQPEPEPAAEPEPQPVITWTAGLTESALDEPARLRLIDDLTLLAAPWTIDLLRRAHHEETSPGVRARIEAALASSEEPAGTSS
jgi:hypothetical protein